MASEQTEGEPVTLETLMAKLIAMEAKQDMAIEKLNQKVDDQKNELMLDIEKRIGDFKESVMSTVSSIQNDCLLLRKDLEAMQAVVSTEPIANVDNTVVLTNLAEPADDPLTLRDNIDQLILALGTDVHETVEVVQVKRLQGRDGKPGLVKVALDSLASKVKVLRAKNKLKDSVKFSKVWMRTSKTHGERVSEMNFKTLLQLIPGGDKLRMTGNGKIVGQDDKQNAGGDDSRGAVGDGPRRRGGGRGGSGGRGRGDRGRGSPIGRA